MVELVVAAGLTALLASFLLSFSGHVLGDWNRVSAKISAYTEARLALDVLARDLQNAVFRADGREWLRSVPIPGNSTERIESDWLMFYANVPDHESETTEGNALCALSYRLAFRDLVTGDPETAIYGLYRAVADPEATFAEALDPATPNLEAFWSSDQDLARDPLESRWFLAANVVDFRIIYHYPDGTTSTLGEALAPGPSVPQHPRSVEVVLTVLSGEGVQQLDKLSVEAGSSALRGLIQRYGHSFSRRISFPPAVL